MDNIVVLLIVAIIYLIPGLNASSRKHPSAGGIWLLNIFFGWTVLGWLIALIWSASGSPTSAPSPSTHVKCPDCREFVLKEARVCKHCGCRLTPQTT